MAFSANFEAAYAEVNKGAQSQKKKFLRDIRSQMADDPISGILDDCHHARPQFVSVSADRRFKRRFYYSYFDLLLVLLDAHCGGAGIRKPVNQLRVMQWRGRRDTLRQVLEIFGQSNPPIDFYRLLIAPYTSDVGVRIVKKIHMK